jgi:hypothetical protein
MKNHIPADPDKTITRLLRDESALRESNAAFSLLRLPVHAASASIDRRQPAVGAHN